MEDDPKVEGMVAWLVEFGQSEVDARETVRLLMSDDPADEAAIREGIASILARLAATSGDAA